MSDERPWISPYNYCQWNPIGRVDTWGMLDDEWEVDKDGCISWLNANKHYDACGNEVDVLYNSSGDNSIEVSKEFMGNSESFTVSDPDGKPHTLDLYSVTGDDNARQIFEFMAQNTDVEWGRVGVGTDKSQDNFIGTFQEPGSTGVVGHCLENGYTIRNYYHNHFLGSNPSPSDVRTSLKISQKFPNAEHGIFYQGAYYKFNPLDYLYNDLPFEIIIRQ